MHARLQPRPGRPAQAPQARPPATDAQPVAQRAAPAHLAPGRETIADYARSRASGLARAAVAANRTGLPNGLKTGIETLSGIALDDVRVHRNSARPAQLQAHAFAQGSDIHLAPGKEGHLPHEAWHVVQQKQGRVRATQRAGGVPVNADIALEDEAHAMGARATRAPLLHGRAGPAAPAFAPASPAAQCIRVDATDIGQTFDVTTNAGVRQNGVLLAIGVHGWFTFSCGTVRGQGNIHARVGAPSSSTTGPGSTLTPGLPSATPPGSSLPGSTPVVPGHTGAPPSSTPSIPSSSTTQGTALPTTQTEFNVQQIATSQGISGLGAIGLIRESFQSQPRTVRVHYPFGSKTISRGGEAFDTPQETTKRAQGMVGYRAKDYGKGHKKVDKDYSDFVDELSDNETETVKRARAKNVLTFLESDPTVKFGDLTSEGRAGLGGLLSVGLISDPMRTEHHSQRTQDDFLEELRKRERGETSFHKSFGSKTGSTFLPARKGGSKEQRKRLRALGPIVPKAPPSSVPQSTVPQSSTTQSTGPLPVTTTAPPTQLPIFGIPVPQPSQHMLNLQANVVGVADDLLRLLQPQGDQDDGNRGLFAAQVQYARNVATNANLLSPAALLHLNQLLGALNHTYRQAAPVLRRDLIFHTNPEDPHGAAGQRLAALEQVFAECGQMAARNALAIVGRDPTAQAVQADVANHAGLNALGNFANNIDENAIRQMLATAGATDIPVMGNIGQVGAVVDHINQNDLAWLAHMQIGQGEVASLQPVRAFMLGTIPSLTLILNIQGHVNAATKQLHWITVRVTRTQHGLAVQYLDSLRAPADYTGVFTALRQLLSRAPAQAQPQAQPQAPQHGGTGGGSGSPPGSSGFGASFFGPGTASSPLAPSKPPVSPGFGTGGFPTSSHGTSPFSGFPSSWTSSPLPKLFPELDDDDTDMS